MLLCAACGDDTATGGGGSAPIAGAGGEAAGGSPEGGAGGEPAGGNGPGGNDPTGGAGGAAADQEAIVLVRGTLFTADMAEAKAAHDKVAAGGEPAAIAAGDFAHDTFLGVPLLGTTPNQYQSFDRWSNDANLDAFYAHVVYLGRQDDHEISASWSSPSAPATPAKTPSCACSSATSA
mgnify:CR=1 FL=1